jgi:hypothetical protein
VGVQAAHAGHLMAEALLGQDLGDAWPGGRVGDDQARGSAA